MKGARVLAEGPMESLVKSYFAFVWVVEMHGEGDALLWRGMERLGKFAILDRSEQGFLIANRLVTSPARDRVQSQEFALLIPQLDDFVWEWKHKK